MTTSTPDTVSLAKFLRECIETGSNATKQPEAIHFHQEQWFTSNVWFNVPSFFMLMKSIEKTTQRKQRDSRMLLYTFFGAVFFSFTNLKIKYVKVKKVGLTKLTDLF